MSHTIEGARIILKEARVKLGLTQEQLATRIGTSQSAIASMERGDTNPTIETLARCAAALDISLEVNARPLALRDPVIELYKRDVDRTLLREHLRLSVHDRLRTLGEWQEDMKEIQYAAKRAKRIRRVAEPAP